ncbi:MAG: TPMT family class I SAM-dependent methyltransferase [Chitinophagaceae bacterium]|jgi:SAM-dependent methyltransferase|nr:TPMT family class I SAM-dependent methyltransferase [Chitinophagaceae bacterium]
MTTIPDPLDDEYWSQRYNTRQTGWDIGKASTPLISYMQQVPPQQQRILIPGCGNAWEAEILLSMGFTNITLIDLSSALVRQLHQRLSGTPIHVLHGNYFDHVASYDLILEQTFLCALTPALRGLYASHTQQLLLPGGKLVGVLFNRSFAGGPPFGGSSAEYQKLLSPFFRIKTLSPCYNSIAPRAGSEVFFIAEKKSLA